MGNGNWPLMPGVIFPDALVDFGHVTEDGQYAWVLEMQCVEILGHVAFVGVNFYSSVKEHTYLEEMKAAWHARGLDEWIYPASGAQLLSSIKRDAFMTTQTGANTIPN